MFPLYSLSGCGTIRKIPMEGTGYEKISCGAYPCVSAHRLRRQPVGGNVYETTFLTLFDTVTTIRGRAESQAAFTEAAKASTIRCCTITSCSISTMTMLAVTT